MASIILGPGEEFEHQHESDSETILRRGSVKISIGGKPERDMPQNESIRIPAKTPHRIRNDGPDYGIVDCYHEPLSHH